MNAAMRTLIFATLLLGATAVPNAFSQSAEGESPEAESIPITPAGPVVSEAPDTTPEAIPPPESSRSEATPDAANVEPKPNSALSDSPALPPPAAAVDEPKNTSEPPKETAASPSPATESAVTQPAATPAPAPPQPIVVQVSSDELNGRMAILEQFLVTQHEREIALYRDTIRLVIAFGVGFAIVAGLGLLAACFLNYRAIIAVQTVVLRRPGGTEEPAIDGLLPESTATVPGIERVEASGTRFQSRMSQLEDRLNEIEHMTGHDGGSELPTAFQTEPTDNSDETDPRPIEAPPRRAVIPRAAIMVHKAQTLMNLGKYSEALTTLEEAASFDGPNSEVHLARGQALEKLGRTPDAIEAYDHAVEIDPGNTNALLMKAGALNRQEKFTEALECYERALEVHRAIS